MLCYALIADFKSTAGNVGPEVLQSFAHFVFTHD